MRGGKGLFSTFQTQFRQDYLQAKNTFQVVVLDMVHYSKQIKSLYELCSELRLIFTRLFRQVETIREIAMNASVAAGHLGSHSKGCVEIAHQINVTGRRMQQYLDAIRTENNQISNQILTILVRMGQLEKYEAAAAQIVDATNLALIRSVIAGHVEKLGELAEQMQPSIHRLSAMIQLIACCHHRVFVTVTAFEIEASDLSGAQAPVIMSLVVRLNAIVEEGQGRVEEAAAVIARVKRLTFLIQEKAHKEITHEKIRAA